MRFEEYIVRNNPDDVLVILKDLGAPKPKDTKDMLRLLLKGVDKYPERTFSMLAEIDTPYKQLILSSTEPVIEVTSKHSNCSGSSNCAGCKCGGNNATSSCDGGCGSSADGVTQVTPPPTTAVSETKDNKTVFVMPSFITQHPIISGAIGMVAITLLVVGAVKLLK